MSRILMLTIAWPCAMAIAAQRMEAAQPLGGLDAVQKFIEQELRYPVAALEAGIKGEVTVVVGVNGDGSVQGMKVWRSVSPECDAEALRLIRMVRFAPSTAAEDRGADDHYFTVPFDPAKYKRWVKARPDRSEGQRRSGKVPGREHALPG